jgi:hypothetical protein
MRRPESTRLRSCLSTGLLWAASRKPKGYDIWDRGRAESGPHQGNLGGEDRGEPRSWTPGLRETVPGNVIVLIADINGLLPACRPSCRSPPSIGEILQVGAEQKHRYCDFNDVWN